MKTDYTESVKNYFEWLCNEYNATIVEKKKEDPKSFGDAMIVYRFKDIFIRFVRGRHQNFIDFAESLETEDWIEFSYLLQLTGLTEGEVHSLQYFNLELEELSNLLKSHFEKIEKLLATSCINNTRKAIKELEKLYVKNQFGWDLPD